MTSPETSDQAKKNFEPLEIMGIFWTVLGLLILVVTTFVKGNTYVPMERGILTNLIAAAILIGIGIFSILRGRRNRHKATLEQ